MRTLSNIVRGVVVFSIAAGLAASAEASRFVRVDLDYLVAANETVIVGEVLEAHSYWTADGTFILTDAKVAVSDVLKGKPGASEIKVTLPGGTVGEMSAVVVGAAQLVPGKSYVLFLRKGDLPGVKSVQTVLDHSQGVFELKMGQDGLRAVSQANGHPLVPDTKGLSLAPGGAEGMPFKALLQTVRERVTVVNRREVK